MATPTSKTPDQIFIPGKRKTAVRTILLVLLVTTGLLYQVIASVVDASRNLPPGRLVDVGGYRLHINCTGTSSPGSLTVILDAGNGGYSLDWSLVQPGVATFTRVCSYDRAGYGLSDDGPRPHTSGRIVSELHTLLRNLV